MAGDSLMNIGELLLVPWWLGPGAGALRPPPLYHAVGVTPEETDAGGWQIRVYRHT